MLAPRPAVGCSVNQPLDTSHGVLDRIEHVLVVTLDVALPLADPFVVIPGIVGERKAQARLKDCLTNLGPKLTDSGWPDPTGMSLRFMRKLMESHT